YMGRRILALFGERVTMQFLSQAMGFADCVLLAMAPLGILTIIVSAIRVKGPPWLKSIIGRARENLSTAEIELMSSTSREVCELWNGLNLVRCQGSAEIWQFICLIPDSVKSGGDKHPQHEVEIKSLRDMLEEKVLVNQAHDGPRDLDREIPRDRLVDRAKGEPKITIVRDMTTNAAPNISLNSHDSRRMETTVWAVISILVQLGVLAFYCCTIYYQPWKHRFSKNDKQVVWYAFPAVAAGTIVLVLGLLICAFVVEQSTREDRYKTMNSDKIRMVWLQKHKTVNDQVFNSFAIYPSSGPEQHTFITSHRKDEQGQPDEPKKKGSLGSTTLAKFTAVLQSLETLTTLGTFLSLLGFFFQFTGIRAMNWRASLVQLGAIILMTILRSWVRRGFSRAPGSTPLVPGFELDWFALSLVHPYNERWMGSTISDNSSRSKAL
ncbi:unnamed protein product, partial [Clonostachys solani]